MDLTNLALFRAVALEQSVTRAAQSLQRAQSNVTTRIQQLEEELGASLFLREGKRISAAEMRTIVEETAAEFDRFDKLYVEATVSLREINANPAPSTAVAA